MQKSKLWTKNFLIITIANFFLYFTFYLLMVTTGLFALEKFNATPSQAGLASGIYIIGTLVLRVFSGRYIEEIGCKKMLYIGFTLFFITTLTYLLVFRIEILYLNRFLNGSAMGIASTATGTIVSKIIPNERRGEGTGYYSLSTTLAAAIGPFLGILILNRFGFSMNFVVCACFLAFSFIAIFFVKVPFENNKILFKNKEAFSINQFIEKKAVNISLVASIGTFSFISVLAFLAPYVKSINQAWIASYFFMIYALFIFISRPFLGRFFDLKGEDFVIYPCMIVFMLGLFILSISKNPIFILSSSAFLGIGYGGLSSSLLALAIKVSAKDKIALASSTSFIFQDFGAGIGPFILGGFIFKIGYNGLYFSMSIILIVNMILYYIVHTRKNKTAEFVNV